MMFLPCFPGFHVLMCFYFSLSLYIYIICILYILYIYIIYIYISLSLCLCGDCYKPQVFFFQQEWRYTTVKHSPATYLMETYWMYNWMFRQNSSNKLRGNKLDTNGPESTNHCGLNKQ